VYSYDPVGNLLSITYPVSPSITLSYDALNRLTNMVDAAGTTRYTYNLASQLLTEDGPWNDDTITYGYTGRMRISLNLQEPNADAWVQTYAYDLARRLTNTTSAAGSFNYAYDGTRQLLPSKLALPNTAYITNTFDSVARMLGTMLLNSSGSVLDTNEYSYNLGSQRTQQVFTVGNKMAYAYDGIGQLTNASGMKPTGALRLHEQFGYSYDAAHNLSNRVDNALVETFNVNNLNELSGSTLSGTFTVAGTDGTNGATSVNVSLNGGGSVGASLYHDATFAATGFTLANGTNTFTAIGQDGLGRVDTNTVVAYLPTTNSFSYDGNGNLLSDGLRYFAYDDENQLISVWVTNVWRSDFVYDGKMRRRIRKEYNWQASITNWLQTSEVRYVYDGNGVIQERDINNLPTTSYTRAGRLLARTDHAIFNSQPSSPNAHAYYHADGNGNITALINGLQIIMAKYEYDPFGAILSSCGPLADANLYRFSSKEYHPNSGLVCYLYRFYDPNLQRWINRDPLSERGGINLYRFVANTPVNSRDALGLAGGGAEDDREIEPPGLRTPQEQFAEAKTEGQVFGQFQTPQREAWDREDWELAKLSAELDMAAEEEAAEAGADNAASQAAQAVRTPDSAESNVNNPPSATSCTLPTSPQYMTPEETRDALNWSLISGTGETRPDHVNASHGEMNLQKPVQGIFYGDPESVINDAWAIAQREGIQPVTVGQPGSQVDIYIIPRPNSGYAGGFSGQLQNLNTVTLITQQGTTTLITGFPGNGLPVPRP
jgi:RHS repeat-associated protein